MLARFARVVFLTCLPLLLAAQDDTLATELAFELGEILVTGQAAPTPDNVATQRQLQKFQRYEVATALDLLPGINTARLGPRNEGVVYVRGFDLRGVPVFLDGIPIYVPYDGYVDLSRFTTFDLAEIQVDRGIASVLYGPNTLGGAINLITQAPTSTQKTPTVDAVAGIFSGQGFQTALNAGARLGQFYVQGGASYLTQETYPLARAFQPTDTEDGGDRENAYRRDRKLNLKLGYNPRPGHEYAVGYVRQDGRKGNPPYAGTDPRVRTRYWQWPDWDKQSLYFISNTALDSVSYLKLRAYYDEFDNRLQSYDDAGYATQTRPYAFTSIYDDHTLGGSAEYATRLLARSTTKVAAHLKRDVHRETAPEEPPRTSIDHTLSLALEHEWRIDDRWYLTPGLSYNHRGNARAEELLPDGTVGELPGSDDGAVNAQAVLGYRPARGGEWRLGVASKTRFATLKDRYSYRLGQALPNPGLRSERANHYELSYRNAAVARGLSLTSSAYLIFIDDIIQRVDGVRDDLFQLQNAGRARFYGGELSLAYRPLRQLETGLNYAYIKRENRSNPELRLVDVPRHQLMGYVDLTGPAGTGLLLSAEYNSARFSSSYGTRVGDFLTADAFARVPLLPWLSLDGGIRNLFDRNYALFEGFPEAGREYVLNLRLRNARP